MKGARTELRPHENADDRHKSDCRGNVMAGTIDRKYSFVNGLRNRKQIRDAATLWRSVNHYVELGGEDQHTDSRQHAVDDRRRHRAKPLTKFEESGGDLNGTGQDHRGSQGF